MWINMFLSTPPHFSCFTQDAHVAKLKKRRRRNRKEKKPQPGSNPSPAVAHSGKIDPVPTALSSRKINGRLWVLDAAQSDWVTLREQHTSDSAAGSKDWRPSWEHVRSADLYCCSPLCPFNCGCQTERGSAGPLWHQHSGGTTPTRISHLVRRRGEEKK